MNTLSLCTIVLLYLLRSLLTTMNDTWTAATCLARGEA